MDFINLHDPSVRFADTSPRVAWGGRMCRETIECAAWR